MRFSVIIPVLNEESTISRCVSMLTSSAHEIEILVVDGGSHDETLRLARETGARVIRSIPGRGSQMNAGAREASGSVLIFLHADTAVPSGFFDFLAGEFEHPPLLFGAFRTFYDARSWLLRVYSFFTRFESALTTFGDQCFVMRKEFFEVMGGYPEWPLFEDVEFLKRARKKTRIRKFPMWVRTSARRFLKGGIAVQQMKNTITIVLFHLGVSPQRLYKRYYGKDFNIRWQDASWDSSVKAEATTRIDSVKG